MILIKQYKVDNYEKDIRLVDYAINLFAELPTKNSVKKALKNGSLRLKDTSAATGTLIEKGMILELYDLQQNPPKPYHEHLDIIYEDPDLAIANKPSGLPTSGNQFRTLENIMVNQITLPDNPEYLKWPKPVHRLDSATSGLVIIAKTIDARYLLGQAFENRMIQKTYHALVMGRTPAHGTMDDHICNKPSRTDYRRIKEVRSIKNKCLTLLKLAPKTGRTHQIRIHCARAGFPIYGDKIYAGKTIQHKGLFLAATGLSFDHPISEDRLNICIDIPPNFLSRMKNEQKRWEKHQN